MPLALVHPANPAKEPPIYFVEVYYGEKIGRVIGEVDPETATFEKAVRMVRDGDHHANRVARIIEVNMAEGTCLDVSHTVAAEIARQWDEDDTPSECLLDFLERHDRVPVYRDEDGEFVDENSQHIIGAFEAGVGRYR